ncbi:hypothetical protein TNCV_2480521 [Trichonephila clavipes]|nr:hypothetical protein TNCV_2480521 [Trichonephila clavipes]
MSLTPAPLKIRRTLILAYRSNPVYLRGLGSLRVKVTDSRTVCYEFEPSTTEDPPCWGAMHVKSVDAQMSSRSCGGEVRREDAMTVVILVT